MSSPKAPQLPCPTCKQMIEFSERYPFRPFCSERCKLIDLGSWADESHRIPGNDLLDDLLSGDLSDSDDRSHLH